MNRRSKRGIAKVAFDRFGPVSGDDQELAEPRDREAF